MSAIKPYSVIARKAGAEAAAERPTLSVAQVADLAGRVPPRYSALILLTTYASLRWGEAIAIRRRDLDLDVATVRIRRSYSKLSTGEIAIGPPSPGRVCGWWPFRAR